MKWLRPASLVVLVLSALLMAAACGDDDTDSTPTAGNQTPAATVTGAATAATTAPTPTTEPYGEILVLAASSLTDAFKEAGTAFEAKNAGSKVTFSFAASSALATQVNEGAKADVFASADTAQMKAVGDHAKDPKTFATNVPVVVVPSSGSPVAAFADLAKSGVRLVLAGPEVPIGRYARTVVENATKDPALGADFQAKVLANVRSNEANVRAVLTKVQLGEADAGIVYSTDAAVAGNEVRVVAIPQAWNVVAEYPVAALDGGGKGGAAFVAFLLGPEGQAILAKYGFGKPLPQ